MKSLSVLALALVVIVLAGCSTGYDITTNGGTKYTGVSRPVLDKKYQVYRFKDAAGRPQTIQAMRVRTIEPHDEATDSNPKFKSPTTSK